MLTCYFYGNVVGADDKSKVLDIDSPDTELFPEFYKALQHECVLQPGDVLFIPG